MEQQAEYKTATAESAEETLYERELRKIADEALAKVRVLFGKDCTMEISIDQVRNETVQFMQCSLNVTGGTKSCRFNGDGFKMIIHDNSLPF